MPEVLTDTRRRILAAIRDLTRERGYPPTVREIGQAVGLRSTSSVQYQLHILCRAGYVWQQGQRRARTVRLVKPAPEDVGG